MAWQRKDSKYEAVAGYMRRLIRSKTVGDTLPSVRELMRGQSVSTATAVRALAVLEREGLIESRVGSGTFVAGRRPRHARAGNMIGVMVPAVDEYFIGKIMRGLEGTLANSGIHTMIRHAHPHPERMAEHAQEFHALGLQGLVFVPLRTADEKSYQAINLDFLRRFAPNRWAGVILDQELPDAPFPCVRSDHLLGARLVAEHFLRLGHRRAAFVSLRYVSSSLQRWQSFRDTIAKGGGRAVHLESSGSGDAAKFWAVTAGRIRKLMPGVTAVFAVNDSIAVCLAAELRKLGVRIPDDISIAGYDNILPARISNPPLTTVAQPLEEIGRRAAQVLIGQIRDPKKVSASVLLPVALVERASTERLRRRGNARSGR